MIRLWRKHWIMVWCVAAVMLPVAVGSLLGGLLGLLMVNQSRPVAVADRSVLALSESYNASGQDLFAQLAGVPGNRVQLAGESGKPGNIVFSPYSIGTAMALALSGARGETEAEMARVLRQQLPRAEIDSTNGKALAVVGQYDGRSNTAKLITANAVLVQGSDLISNDYLARAKAHYAAEIFRNTDLAAVNNWVSQKTEGNVDKVIDRLDPKSAAVVLNAVYFKAQWRDPFDRKLTQTEAFAISPSQKMQVPMMRGEGSYAVVTQPGFSAIRLPYQSPQLHMVIVLPDEIGALHELNARLNNATLARLLSDLRGRSGLVDLRLPRFKAQFEVTLKDHFRALGMTRTFDRAAADFSGMTGGSGSISIEDIAHVAVIDVAEEGTEAAAATATAMAVGRPQAFHVNRPFLFYIVEATTNAILFQGRIVDPR